MTIKETEISYSISKELSEVQGSGFKLEDVTGAYERSPVQPKLLTALLSPSAGVSRNTTDTFKYDDVTNTAVLPTGKSYSERGGDVPKDRPRQLRFAIPSEGLRLNVSPQDWAAEREAGSSDFATEEQMLIKQMAKADKAFALQDEKSIAQLITADTNNVSGGPFEVYNFYTIITGGARAAKTFLDLANATGIENTMRRHRQTVQEEVGKSGDSANGVVCICGDNAFDARYELEKDAGLVNPVKFGLDLQGRTPIGEQGFGAGVSFNYAYFDSIDGIRYINYGSEIISGSKLIGTTDMWLIPLGTEQLLHTSYAPAQTRTYTNTVAQEMYAWTKVDEFTGITTYMERNKLFASINPRLILNLSSAAS